MEADDALHQAKDGLQTALDHMQELQRLIGEAAESPQRDGVDAGSVLRVVDRLVGHVASSVSEVKRAIATKPKPPPPPATKNLPAKEPKKLTEPAAKRKSSRNRRLVSTRTTPTKKRTREEPVKAAVQAARPAREPKRVAPDRPARKKADYSLYALFQAPNGAVVLYDPATVKGRGVESRVVTVPVARKNNISVKRSELESVDFERLSPDVQHSVTDRLCAEVLAAASHNLDHILSSGGNLELMKLFAADDERVVADVSSALYGKGALLQMVARNAALLAAHRVQQRHRGAAAQMRGALAEVVEHFHVDWNVELLVRYGVVGELFHRCRTLMLCDLTSTFLKHKAVFGRMHQSFGSDWMVC